MRGRKALCLLAIAAMAGFVQAAENSDSEPRELKGQIRVGGFFVNSIDTTLSATPSNIPLGVHLRLSEDLGLGDSVTVPRLMLAYRFSKRHRLDAGWYRLSREGSSGRRLNTELYSTIRTEDFKIAYTWIFHESEKVMLGLSPGLHLSSFNVAVSAEGLPDLEQDETLLAPLPVIGGRLVFRITPKLTFLTLGDWFALKYDEYQGYVTDVYVIFEHRTSRHVGFGAGFNRLSLNVQLENQELFADLDHVFFGVTVYAAFYF